jgi:hypothetical protein
MRIATGKTKISIYFDDRILEALRVIGRARGVTYSELIREACRKFAVVEGGRVVQESHELKRIVK